jgi:hypothetical protein
MVHLGFRIQQRVLFFGDGPRAWQSILGVTLPGAFGWPAFVFVLIGFARALWKRRYPDIVLLVFLLPAFAAMAGMTWILPRYPLPLVPALAVIAAEALVSVLGRAPRWSVAALVVVLVAQPLDRIVAYDRLASVPDTRQLATDWIAGHVPPRARIAVCRGYGAPVVNADSRVSPSFDREVVNCSLEDIQAAHADYLVTHTHPAVDSLEPTDEARRWLEDHAKPLVTLTPFGTAPRTDTCFFRSDEFYLPYCGLGQVDRGGPEIIVWALPPPR